MFLKEGIFICLFYNVVSNFLGAEVLVDFLCEKMSDFINNKTAGEIRENLLLNNDFDEDDEVNIIRCFCLFDINIYI
jgi:hypothetical protein